MQKITKQQRNQAIRETVSALFKNKDGEPYILKEGQCDMFAACCNPDLKWVWISASTRYGKSEVLAIVSIYLAAVFNLKIPIVAGTKEKAAKIMDYVIQHVGDAPELYANLLNVPDIKAIDKLKIAVSKSVLRWSTGGWIFINSVESKIVSREAEGVVGEGGDVVLLEESGLINKKEQVSKVIRMPERDRGWGKLIQSGNCIEGSVFEMAYRNPLYYKVLISLQQAKLESGWTDEEIEEKKSQTTAKDWKRYYEVVFPAEGEFTYYKPQSYDILPAEEMTYFGAVDFAMGETEKGCYTAIVILGMTRSRQTYEIESIIERMGLDEAMNRILNLRYKFARFGVEGTLFQKYFYKLLQEKSRNLGTFVPFVSLDQTRNKKERIESLEPHINTGQILFRGSGELWNEMQEYPSGEYVDGLDALEMCWRIASQASGGMIHSARTNLYPTSHAKATNF